VSTVAFLVAHEGVEQIELTRPWQDVQEAGYRPLLVSTTGSHVQGYEHLDVADRFEVDRQVNEVDLDAIDLLLLPGGVANPDALRLDERAVKLVRDALAAGTPVAAICHAPWMLVSAGIARGRRLTSFFSIKDDLVNAGAEWVDEEAVQDGNIITSRDPGDLPVFCRTLIEAMARVSVT
jgi:protease I